MMEHAHGSIKSYITGFVISLILTGISYMAVMNFMSPESVFSLEIVIALVMSLAVLQMFVQLIYFLHLGSKNSPKWNLLFFISTVLVVLIVVVGSLWIMYHLNYNMMPQEMEMKILEKERIHR